MLPRTGRPMPVDTQSNDLWNWHINIKLDVPAADAGVRAGAKLVEVGFHDWTFAYEVDEAKRPPSPSMRKTVEVAVPVVPVLNVRKLKRVEVTRPVGHDVADDGVQISPSGFRGIGHAVALEEAVEVFLAAIEAVEQDRKSTRLNSSH